LINIVNDLYQKNKNENLCISGGSGMNSVANGILFEKTKYKNIYIPPEPGDAGGSLGSAAYQINKINNTSIQFNDNPYLGPSYSDEAIKKDIDDNMTTIKENSIKINKFDLIINDVSGISDKLISISSWFKNIPCNSGSDGTDLTIEVLKNFRLHLNKKGRMYFPVISLSNEKKIFRYLNRNKIKYKIVSENDWPLPKELYKSLNLLKKLKSKNYINFKKKFNILIASTKIIRIVN